MTNVKIDHLVTEQRNEKTKILDDMSIHEILNVMNEEDQQVPLAVAKVLPQIEQAVKHIVQALRRGGRLIYIGSGTSGRLGVLDAVECPPTFNTDKEVIGLLAGGEHAFVKAKEGAEDSEEQGAQDIILANVAKKDVLIGIAASGRTPHTIGALRQAKEIGAYTISITCNPNSLIGQISDLAIDMNVGAEVLTGSTRLKAGTAQKLVLNMLSTTAMIKIGKTYENLMVDMKATNDKLIERSKQIIMQATNCDYEKAQTLFENSGRHLKIAIVMEMLHCSKAEAEKCLKDNNGFVKKAIR